MPHFMLITGQAQSQQSPPAQARGGYRLFALGIYYNTSDLYGKASDFLKAHRKMKVFWKDRKMYGIVEKERDRETAYL